MTAPFAEVIGDPIAHSKSPVIHGFWLAALGLEGRYDRAHVTADGLAEYLATRRADPAWRGCNVTIPHKLSVLDHVEDRGGVRDTIGAANLVLRDGDALVATNTDAAGFYAPLAEVDLADVPAVVIGAGGATRAVLFALARAGAGPVTIQARSPLKAAGLLATFGLKGDVVPMGAPLPDDAGLVVNASPLGMVGQPPLAIDLSPLPEDAIVYDVVYAPLETPLLAAARARALETVDGLEMLIGQAALAFELLFGAAPPRDRDAELRALLTA